MYFVSLGADDTCILLDVLKVAPGILGATIHGVFVPCNMYDLGRVRGKH